MTMIIKIRQVWNAINKGLTYINVFFVMVLFQAGIPKKYENRKIPLVANIILLLIFVFVLIYWIYSYSNHGQEGINVYKGIATNMSIGRTTTFN